MEPTLNETPVETQREGTNLETYGASESHTVTNTVPTVSENETMVRSRENHDNADTVSWMNTIIVPPTTGEFRRHVVIMITMMIAFQVIYIGMEDAQHGQSVRITPMMGGIQSQTESQGQITMPHVTEECKSFLEKNTSASVQGGGAEAG